MECSILATTYSVNHFDSPDRTDSTRRALAARFLRAELQGKSSLGSHVDGLVENHQSTVTEHSSGLSQRFVPHRDIEAIRRQVGTQGATDLNSADRSATERSTAEVIHQLVRADAESGFHDSTPGNVARQLEHLRSMRCVSSQRRVRAATASQNRRDTRDGQDIVDHRRSPEQTLNCRKRGLGSHHASAPFDALQHRRLFPAHVRARAHADLDIKRDKRSENSLTQPPVGASDVDRLCHHRDGIGVLRAHIHDSAVGTDGVGGNRHPLQEQERIPFHHHSVGVRAAIALVGVDADVLVCGRRRRFPAVWTGRSFGHCPPLDSGGKAGTSSAAKAGVDNAVDHVRRGHRERGAQTHHSSVREVVLRVDGVCDAHPLEYPPVLTREEVDVLDPTDEG